MKKTISLLLMVALLLINSIPSFATSSSTTQGPIDPYALTNQELTNKEAFQIESEIEILNNHNIDTSILKKVDVKENGNEYTLDYQYFEEKVIIENSDNEKTIIIANDGEKSNIICFMKDGSLLIDGDKIEVSPIESLKSPPRGITYKGVKSLSPYGSLKDSSYSKFLSSGKQNIALGKALDQFTATALGTAVMYFHPYVGLAGSAASIGKALWDVLKNINPKSEELGCEYTTYTTVGGDDYKYMNKIYTNAQCKGDYVKHTTYEHFTVY